MGIRGLTTFVTSRCDKYLLPYELHDCHLVVDGNNIASHLYKWHCTRYDCFGGDYDAYARCIAKFFTLLSECNITPLVILDGSYEDRKLKTVYHRIRERVKSGRLTKRTNAIRVQMFPLLLRDVFLEVVKRLGVKMVRCDFEADYEMACIAKKLDCPILSYDSDFFLFDVKYIPFSTVTLSVARKAKGVKSMSCQVYSVDSFLSCFKGLSKECLPLVAVLLGNDYIEWQVFEKFYQHIKLPRGTNEQQRRIGAVIKFLQDETYESAVKKVLERIKLPTRLKVAQQLKQVTDAYICSRSLYLHYLEETKPESVLNFDCSIEDSTENSDVPKWFQTNFRLGLYPTAFMDLVLRNVYFFVPQLEDYENVCSHQISLPIVAAMHKILTSGTQEDFNYVSRANDVGVKKFTSTTSELPLPKLEEIIDITVNTAKGYLESILGFRIDPSLDSIPEAYRLYFLAVGYWFRNSTHKISHAHIYALLLSAFVLDKIDQTIGYFRSEKAFANKFKPKPNQKRDVCSPEIDQQDCVNCLHELIKYFKYEDKLSNSSQNFNLHIVDAFAQFQTCFVHLKYLNCLLNNPYRDCDVANKYNGTFVYNICANLLKRNDPSVYLEEVLKQAPGALNYVKNLLCLVRNMCGSEIQAGCKQKQRRRKKESVKQVDDFKVQSGDSEDDGLFDNNNMYALLKRLPEEN